MVGLSLSVYIANDNKIKLLELYLLPIWAGGLIKYMGAFS